MSKSDPGASTRNRGQGRQAPCRTYALGGGDPRAAGPRSGDNGMANITWLVAVPFRHPVSSSAPHGCEQAGRDRQGPLVCPVGPFNDRRSSSSEAPGQARAPVRQGAYTEGRLVDCIWLSRKLGYATTDGTKSEPETSSCNFGACARVHSHSQTVLQNDRRFPSSDVTHSRREVGTVDAWECLP